MSSQSRPLSYSYGSPAGNTCAVNQNRLDMPDLNDFIRSTVSRGSGRHSFNPSQLRFQSPPYPLHDPDEGMSSEHIVYRSRSASIRQPTAEDFLPKRHPSPARHSISPQPVGECHSDQDQPVTVPDSQLQKDTRRRHDDHTTDAKLANPDTHTLKRRPKGTARKPHRTSQLRATDEGSQSAPRPNSNASSASSKAPSLPRRRRVKPIGSDTYQPTLGGLHNISDLKRRDSKCDRVKRAMSKLNPLRRQRRSWD